MAILKSPAALRLCACAAAILCLLAAPTAGTKLPEPQAKAGFLYNLGLFVDWPTPARAATLDIGVVESGPVAAALRTVEGRTLKNRPVRIRELRQGDDPSAVHILYLGDMDGSAQAMLLQATASPVVTVGDDERFMRAGGMIRLYFDNARLRFEIDVAKADRVQLKLSSKLLSLARVLRDGHVVRD
jgi:hypothetical protein